MPSMTSQTLRNPNIFLLHVSNAKKRSNAEMPSQHTNGWRNASTSASAAWTAHAIADGERSPSENMHQFLSLAPFLPLRCTICFVLNLFYQHCHLLFDGIIFLFFFFFPMALSFPSVAIPQSYLAIPSKQMVEHHCIIVPTTHGASTRTMDKVSPFKLMFSTHRLFCLLNALEKCSRFYWFILILNVPFISLSSIFPYWGFHCFS